jgi:hypothetical protein
MKASSKIKLYILELVNKNDSNEFSIGSLDTEEQILKIWNEFKGTDLYYEYADEIRAGDVITDIPITDYSRHYESRSVATQLNDGSWVGWTYWYGGGKYGEPEAIDWIEDSYDLEHTSEMKTVEIHRFIKKE